MKVKTAAKTLLTIGIAWFAIAAIVLILLGCNLVPTKQLTDANGNPYWIDAKTNTATIERVDPETGQEREPLIGKDPEAAQDTAKKLIHTVSGFIPPPYDGPVYALLGLGNLALGWFLTRSNKKKLEAHGINVDLIESIENSPEAKRALVSANGHNPKTKAMVTAVTENKSIRGLPAPEKLQKAKNKLDKKYDKKPETTVQ